MTIVGGMSGIILALVKWLGNRIHTSIDKLITTTNIHTTEITVERFRNDDQDQTLEKHQTDINSLKERVWQVTYKKA